MITSFATDLTKELYKITPIRLENGIKEKRKINRRLFSLIKEILIKTNQVFTEDQQTKLVEAMRFAANKHAGKYRKDKVTPYFLHLLEVIFIPIELGIYDYTLIIAGLLHDLIEDTETKPKEIAERFGERVRNIVELLSRFKMDESRNKRYWSIMKNEPDLSCKWRVLILKFADRIHYFMTCDHPHIHPDSRQRKLHETNTEFPELYSILRETHTKLSKVRSVKDRRSYDQIPRKLYSRLEREIKKHT